MFENNDKTVGLGTKEDEKYLRDLIQKVMTEGHDRTVGEKKSYKKGSDLTNSSLSLLKFEVKENNLVEFFSKKFKIHDQNS